MMMSTTSLHIQPHNMNIRRRHSLNPDSLRISPLAINSHGALTSPRAILTRNQRSFVFSSAGLVSATTSHTPHSANNVQPHVGGSSIVAIDSKIEQAMDLVKTHLMFAVREEVDHLRSRIMELETAVVHLEAENSILREHVPSDILKSLSIQPSSNSHGATAMT